MVPIYSAVDALIEAMQQQAQNDGWTRFKREFDDGVWFRLELDADEDTTITLYVHIDRAGKMTNNASHLYAKLGTTLKAMFDVLPKLMVEWWAQYRKENG